MKKNDYKWIDSQKEFKTTENPFWWAKFWVLIFIVLVILIVISEKQNPL